MFFPFPTELRHHPRLEIPLCLSLDLLSLSFFQTTTIAVTATTIPDCYKTFKLKYFLFELPFHANGEMFNLTELFLSFLFHEFLFYFTLLLFPYFYHNLFDAGIHFLSKLILAD